MMLATSLLIFTLLAQSDAAAQGIAAFERGDLASAKGYLEQSPGNPRAVFYLALSRAGLGHCEDAMGELARQFAETGATPESTRLRRLAGLALAQCQMSARQFPAAGQTVAALEKTFPADPDVLYLAAEFHLKAWNDAINRMYRNAPASYRVDQLSAEVFETEGKYAEAIAEYRKAIGKNPKAINLHFRLGRVLLLQSHEPAALEAARREFAAELSLNPFDAVAEYEVARILSAQGKGAEGAPHMERAAELRPDFPEALIGVARLRSEAKRYPEAVALLERAVKLQPRSEPAHYNLMMAYRNAGRTADALREKAEIDKLQRPPEGEFTDFLKRLGEKPK